MKTFRIKYFLLQHFLHGGRVSLLLQGQQPSCQGSYKETDGICGASIEMGDKHWSWQRWQSSNNQDVRVLSGFYSGRSVVPFATAAASQVSENI